MKKFNFVLVSGILLVAISFAIFVQNFVFDYHAFISSGNTLQKIEDYLGSDDSKDSSNNSTGKNGTIEKDASFCFENSYMEMPVYTVEEHSCIGFIHIPSINCKLPIINEFSYDNLNYSPCRYFGSAYQKNLVIAAHNYLSHFGYLQNLNVGDKVYFTDIYNNEFVYKVALLEILTPQDVEEMCSGEWDLTLFTCTYGGQFRTTVRCELIS